MLIETPKATAIKTLSFRIDNEGYCGIKKLSDTVNTSPSVLMRLAISDLLSKQTTVKAKSLAELMNDGAK